MTVFSRGEETTARQEKHSSEVISDVDFSEEQRNKTEKNTFAWPLCIMCEVITCEALQSVVGATMTYCLSVVI